VSPIGKKKTKRSQEHKQVDPFLLRALAQAALVITPADELVALETAPSCGSHRQALSGGPETYRGGGRDLRGPAQLEAQDAWQAPKIYREAYCPLEMTCIVREAA